MDSDIGFGQGSVGEIISAKKNSLNVHTGVDFAYTHFLAQWGRRQKGAGKGFETDGTIRHTLLRKRHVFCLSHRSASFLQEELELDHNGMSCGCKNATKYRLLLVSSSIKSYRKTPGETLRERRADWLTEHLLSIDFLARGTLHLMTASSVISLGTLQSQGRKNADVSVAYRRTQYSQRDVPAFLAALRLQKPCNFTLSLLAAWYPTNTEEYIFCHHPVSDFLLRVKPWPDSKTCVTSKMDGHVLRQLKRQGNVCGGA
ncbi:hypothetical protein DFJ77DRAFT_540583 [Powellomyces hirtus]|nr:hypothetical protein DFJ77DRAFT_540583 [Powellomyces hirtus]